MVLMLGHQQFVIHIHQAVAVLMFHPRILPRRSWWVRDVSFFFKCLCFFYDSVSVYFVEIYLFLLICLVNIYIIYISSVAQPSGPMPTTKMPTITTTSTGASSTSTGTSSTVGPPSSSGTTTTSTEETTTTTSGYLCLWDLYMFTLTYVDILIFDLNFFFDNSSSNSHRDH